MKRKNRTMMNAGQTQTPETSPSGEVTVVIVEDDAGIREGLAAFLDRAPGVRCLATFSDADEALAASEIAKADVILMDINLPGMSGIEATRALKRLRAEARILMLTVYEDNRALFDSLKAGACGYLLKRTATEELVDAIHAAHKGGMPLTPRMASKVAGYFQELETTASEVDSLTHRERQTLELLSEGYLYKEIAQKMGVTPLTVHQFLKRIYEKLQVRSRTEAVVKFLRR